MTPLYYLTSGILVVWYHFFTTSSASRQGRSWALSIIFLTIVIRIALIPLFVKQIKNSRNLQLLQPKVKELQKKYGHDRERLTQETMKLYKETGTNPLASCLPLLLQMPIFLALFRTLNERRRGDARRLPDDRAGAQPGNATLFGVAISGLVHRCRRSRRTKILAAILVVVMTATTFTTQRQLMRKNMPESAMTGQYAQQQKILLYVLPVVFAVGGIAFPIGVLLYWTTSNLWTMGQQFYVIRNNPTPGTPAFEAKQKRDAERHHGPGRHGGRPRPTEPSSTRRRSRRRAPSPRSSRGATQAQEPAKPAVHSRRRARRRARPPTRRR